MRKLYFLGVLVLPLFLFSQQQAKNISYGGEKIGFWQHLPATYNTDGQTKYPVLIFLHGIGERGNGTSDLWMVNRIAIPHYISQGNPMRFYVKGKWYSFIVLSPQCPLKYSMWPNSYIDAMIDYAEKNLRVDKSRIYLTGLSMGGGGAWQYASASSANAKKLAAIATSSAPPTMSNGCVIAKANLPLYAFQAKDDKTVNISSLYNTVNAILACKPAIKPIEKVWPTGGHNIFDRAFDVGHAWQTPNVYEWLLGYSRSDGSKPVQAAPPKKPNLAPVAKAGDDLIIQSFWNFAPLLNGATSKDPDGWIKSVVWTKIYGPSSYRIVSPNSLNTRVQNLKSGKYVFRITITDDKGAQALDEVTVIVNSAPVLNISGPQAITLPSNYALLQSSQSKDPGGWITSWKWSRISGPAVMLSNTTKPYLQLFDLVQGDYIFRLNVKDNEGGVAAKDFKLKVIKPQAKSAAANRAELAVPSFDTALNAAAYPTINTAGSLSVYPNPSVSSITLTLNSNVIGKASLFVYDMAGKLVKTLLTEKHQQVETNNLDVSGLIRGTYMITADIGGNIIATKKFIKQ